MIQTVFLGVDFGTSYTKIAFQVLPSAVKSTVSLTDCKDNPFFPSVVYFDPGTNSLSLNQEHGEIKVKYFKYAMAFDQIPFPVAEQMQSQDSKQAAKLCSIFYLACLFRLMRQAILPHLLESGHQELRWAVNMGMPTKSISNQSTKSLFRDVLSSAWTLSFDPAINSQRITIADLLNCLHNLSSAVIRDHLNVVPELFAEVLLYHQNPNIPQGLYTVVDIGGGTMDVTSFQKVQRDKRWNVLCMSESIAPLGAEIVGTSINAIKTTYGSCVWEARNRLLTALQNGLPHKWFLLGGGRTVPKYRQCISYMANVHSQYGIVNQTEGDIEELVPDGSISIGNRPDRLIISKMLAQPFGAIPPVGGNPAATPVPTFQIATPPAYQYGITDT